MLHPRKSENSDALSPGEMDFVLANARMLRHASGDHGRLLRGKNLGLLCQSAESADGIRFRQAAAALGARVTHIRPDFSEASSPHLLCQTARMLGRLYDAIECQGLPPALVHQIKREAGIPVFDGVACEEHVTAGLAALLGNDGSFDDRRNAVLQAVLVGSLS